MCFAINLAASERTPLTYAGATVQSVLMVIKIGAIVGLVATGLFFAPSAPYPAGGAAATGATAMGAALVPVLFAYGGWQTSSFVAGETLNVNGGMVTP